MEAEDQSPIEMTEEEMIAAADHLVREEITKLEPGAHFVSYNFDANLFIYGQIIDPAARVLDGRELSDLDPDEQSEVAAIEDIYGQSHMKNFRATLCYSPACPEGEEGDTHLAEVHKPISEEAFNLAKAAGWPQDKAVITELVEVIG